MIQYILLDQLFRWFYTVDWRARCQGLLAANVQLVKTSEALQRENSRQRLDKSTLVSNLDHYIIQLQHQVLESDMALEQARVDYMEIETESAKVELKYITLKDRLREKEEIVVTQESLN